MKGIIVAVLTDSGAQEPQVDDQTYRILIDPELTPAMKRRRKLRGLTDETHARLIGVESGDTRIMATLEYIDAAVAKRGLTVVERRTLTDAEVEAERLADVE